MTVETLCSGMQRYVAYIYSAQKMEAASFSEVLVFIYQTIW
jgi:hypothetical protein